MASRYYGDWWTIILVLVIIAMGVEIGYLVYQNRQLKAYIDDPRKFFSTLKETDTVPAITAIDVNGRDASLNYSADAPHTLLLWFSPGCESCHDNVAFWNEIYRDYHSEKLRYLGLCAGNADEAKDFITEYGIEFPVVSAMDDRLVETYKGRVLPQTILISPGGSILGIWPGVLDLKRKEDIVALLQKL